MKRSVLSAVVLLTAFNLSADVLYWTVDQSASPASVSFYYAQMVAQNEGGTRTELDVFDMPHNVVLEGVKTVDAKEPLPGNATADVWANLGDANWNGFTFYVELLGVNDNLLATSTAGWSYSDLSGHIKSSQLDKPSVLTASSFIAVPEPTGGLLLLLGVSALILQRKRV